MYFIKINITQHTSQSEIENEKANIMLLVYMDSMGEIVWWGGGWGGGGGVPSNGGMILKRED